MNNFDKETWVKTMGTVQIVRILNSHTGDSTPFSVVSCLPLAEDDFSVPSNTGLFLKPYLFVGLVLVSLSCAYSFTRGLSSKETLNAPD